MLMDAGHGIKLVHFEYLTMIKNHGFPALIGVLTHLERFKKNNLNKKELHGRWKNESQVCVLVYYLKKRD